MNYRAVGKLGFLLVIIGFSIPWISGRDFVALFFSQMNGFQLAELSIQLGSLSRWDYSFTAIGYLLYAWFILAIAGLAIGVVLFFKKRVPIFIDWIIIIICMILPLYLITEALTFTDDIRLHFGLYATLFGSMIAFTCQIIPASCYYTKKEE